MSEIVERLALIEPDWADVERRSLRLRRQRPRLTRRRLAAAAVVVVVLALVLPTLALSGVLSSVFGISNHGSPAHATPFNQGELNGSVWLKAGIHVNPANTANPDTLVQLALRDGIGVYSALSQVGNHRCYYTGQYYPKPDLHPNRLHLSGSCGLYVGNYALPERLMHVSGLEGKAQADAWLRTHPFPSPARPVLNLSESPFVGVAADSVRSVELLSQSDCRPIFTVPVIDNVYIDADPPSISWAFLVARDASGKVIWHSAPSYGSLPSDPNVPRDCGLGS